MKVYNMKAILWQILIYIKFPLSIETAVVTSSWSSPHTYEHSYEENILLF